jgi:hypothetical protein
MVDETLQAFSFVPASKLKLGNPAEVQDATRDSEGEQAP